MKFKKGAWYKKKRYILATIGFVTTVILGFCGNTPVSIETSSPVVTSVVEQDLIQIKTQAYVLSQDSVTDSELSNDNHYVNSVGETVHSPAYSNSAPTGASARCRDGTYSFSQSRRGTCSHHGGVAQWL